MAPGDSDDEGFWVRTECGGGGDCFFRSVGVALGEPFATVRRWAADSVTEENVDRLLAYYTHAYRAGAWDRGAITTLQTAGERRDAFRAVVGAQGGVYQGDDTTMRLLALGIAVRGLGFLVMDLRGKLHQQCFLNRGTRRVVVLVHMPGHWQLAGWVADADSDADVDVYTTFDPRALPASLKRKLSGVGVDFLQDFADWGARLELEGVGVGAVDAEGGDGGG